MAHKLYLIRETESGAEGVCLFEKHNALELAGMLNEHYATSDKLNKLFKGGINKLECDNIIFKSDVVFTSDSINANMDHGADLLFDCVVIFKNGKWTAYRSLGGFREYGEILK
jgi:hypothetical protein